MSRLTRAHKPTVTNHDLSDEQGQIISARREGGAQHSVILNIRKSRTASGIQMSRASEEFPHPLLRRAMHVTAIRSSSQ